MGEVSGLVENISFFICTILVFSAIALSIFGENNSALPHSYSELEKVKTSAPFLFQLPNGIICFGIFLAILSFLGSMVIQAHRVNFTLVYSITLLLTVIFQLIFLSLLFLFRSGSIDKSKDGFSMEISEYKENKVLEYPIDLVQDEEGCCGTNSYKDWIRSIGFIPPSCCGLVDVLDVCTEESVKEIPACGVKMEESIKEFTVSSVMALMLLLPLEVAMIALTVITYLDLKRGESGEGEEGDTTHIDEQVSKKKK